RSRSGDKRNTVDLLERGLACLHRVERGIAEEARAARARSLLELAHGSASRDELADLVVEDHQLGDRFAALVSRAAALPAPASQTKTVRLRLRLGEPRFLEERFLGPVVLRAVRA